MSVAEDVKNATRLWIDRLNNGTGLEGAWRLQRIDRRSRKVEGAEGGIEERPARIRRFAKGIPANWVDEAVKYLISLAPYTDIVFNGTKLEGTYAPTRTWWERDEGATVDRGQMRENTYTLYQDLVDWKNADSTDFDAGGSCSETVHMRYEYDTFSIEDVPSGGQGVTTSIQAVSRNEDGTFNYAVVTRKAKTAIGTVQTVKCDEYQTVSQQVFQNLYGVEGAYTYDDGVTPVDGLPRPCDDRRTGLLIELATRKNDDCTYDVTVTTTKSKNVSPAEHTKQKTLRGVTETIVNRNVLDDSVNVRDIGERVQIERNPDGTFNRSFTRVVKESVGDIGSSCQQTMFEHSHVKNENVATRPVEEATLAGGGKTYQVQARATEEGTWDVSRTTTTELKQEKAQRVRQKTLRGVTETYVDRNVSVSDVTVTNVGDRVQVEMTQGGLWNRTVTRVIPESVGVVGASCSATRTVHTDATVDNIVSEPSVEVGSVAVNEEVKIEARKTEEGTWDRTVTKSVHYPRSVSARAGTVSRVETIERGINQTSFVDEVPRVNQEVGVSLDLNGFGSMSVSKRKVTYIPQTVFASGGTLHARETIESGVNQPADAVRSTPSTNQRIDVSATLNDHGSMSVQRRIINYQSHQFSASAGTTVVGEQITAVVNQTSPSINSTILQNKRVELSIHPNDYGSVSYTKKEVTYQPTAFTASSYLDTETRTTTVTINSRDVPSGGKNTLLSVTPNEHGSCTVSKTTITPISRDTGWLTWTSTNKTPIGTYKYKHGLRVFRNLSSCPSPPSGVNSSVNVGINQYGFYDGSISYSEMTDFTRASSSSSDGGSKSGNITITERMVDNTGKRWKRTVTLGVISYWGVGNEASEASDRASGRSYPGLSLPTRTYLNKEDPGVGPWEDD